MRKPAEGDHAPDFNLPANNGEMISLKGLRGKTIVLYFYPKDDTPGCTVEACGFRDVFQEIERYDAVVLGVSPDDSAKHEKFIKKYDLPFLLLSDSDKKTCRDYGVWVEKNMYGRKYMGVARTTFIIDRIGKIIRIFEKVKPEEHKDDVLDFLKKSASSSSSNR